MKNTDYNLNDEPNFPLDDNGKNPFGLPMDYFSKFEDNLKQKLELENELTEFPVLSSIQKTNAYLFPNSYFENTLNSIECHIELSNFSTLQSIKKPFYNALEVNYSGKFQIDINKKIDLIEELKNYETLYEVSKINAFIVSDTYFETFSDNIKEKICHLNEVKSSILNKISELIFGRAMAFSFGLTLIIGLSIFFYNSNKDISTISDCKTLACLEKQEILNNSKIISNFDEDQLMELVDVNSLNKQLNNKKEQVTKTNKHNIDSISEDDLLDEL